VAGSAFRVRGSVSLRTFSCFCRQSYELSRAPAIVGGHSSKDRHSSKRSLFQMALSRGAAFLAAQFIPVPIEALRVGNSSVEKGARKLSVGRSFLIYPEARSVRMAACRNSKKVRFDGRLNKAACRFVVPMACSALTIHGKRLTGQSPGDILVEFLGRSTFPSIFDEPGSLNNTFTGTSCLAACPRAPAPLGFLGRSEQQHANLSAVQARLLR